MLKQILEILGDRTTSSLLLSITGMVFLLWFAKMSGKKSIDSGSHGKQKA